MASIGIDFGTLHCTIGYWSHKENVFVPIPDSFGNYDIPSKIIWRYQDILVGETTKTIQNESEENISIEYLKLQIGSQADELMIKNVFDKDQNLELTIRGKQYTFTCISICALLLAKLKRLAERSLHQSVETVVITVPSYFGCTQREYLKNAGVLGGFQICKIVNDVCWIGAELSLNYFQQTNFLMIDFGAMFLSICVAVLEDGIVEVVANAGSCNQSGELFTTLLTRHVTEQWKKDYHIDIDTGSEMYNKLRRLCEDAKKQLSYSLEASIQMEVNGHLELKVSRQSFEELCEEAFQSFIKMATKVVEQSKKQIHHIVLAGGSSKIPRVQQLVKEHFGGIPIQLPKENLALKGASMMASILAKHKSEILEKIVVIESIAFPVGILTNTGKFHIVFPSGASSFASSFAIMSTQSDNQHTLGFHVFEGDNEDPWKNRFVGYCEVVGIMPAPVGVPQIHVNFNMHDGMLSVHAVDRSTRSYHIVTSWKSWIREGSPRIHFSDEKVNTETLKQLLRVLVAESDLVPQKLVRKFRYNNSAKPMIPLVVDNGSGFIKMGFAGDDTPRVIYKSVVGRSKPTTFNSSPSIGSVYVADEALYHRLLLTLNYPIKRGIITDWKDMKDIWNHGFYPEMGVAPEDHAILLTEYPLNPKENREKTIQMMFECFKARAFYLASSGVLAMYGTGRSTGISLECGHEVTHVTAVHDQHNLHHTSLKLDIGGKELTEGLSSLLLSQYYPSAARFEIATDIKERFCFISSDFNNEKDKRGSMNYELPDGQIIDIGPHRCQITEALFQPSFVGLEAVGIHEMVFDSINKCEMGLHKELFSNIVLSGGTTLLPGFEARITKELKDLVPSDTKIEVISTPERKFTVWIGGSIMASLSSFDACWITKQEYEEQGAAIVHTRCV